MPKRLYGAGESNPRWRGGRYKAKESGYVFVRRPDHPNADKRGYVEKRQPRPCPVCGVEFVSRQQTWKFCSPKCYYKSRRKDQGQH